MRSVEIKVGLFMMIALAVAAGLIVKFGGFPRGTKDSYPVYVIFPNVGGIVPDAAVMYAGIPVGKVANIQLTPMLEVRVELAIHRGVVIRDDAKFIINQSGLLGDRYVDVVPGTATPELKAGAVIHGTTSVDLSEAIRGVVEILRQAAGTIERVDHIIQRLDTTVLDTQTLVHASAAVASLDAASTNAVALIVSLRTVVEENRAHIDQTLTKFEAASTSLSRASQRVDDLVAANQEDVRTAIRNLAEGTTRLEGILGRLEKGEGTAGKILVDPTLHDELVKLIEGWRRFGILYHDKSPSRPSPAPATDPARRGLVPVPARPAGAAATNQPPTGAGR